MTWADDHTIARYAKLKTMLDNHIDTVPLPRRYGANERALTIAQHRWWSQYVTILDELESLERIRQKWFAQLPRTRINSRRTLDV